MREPFVDGTPDAGTQVIQARLLRHFPQVVRDLGGDPQSLLCAVGLDEEACDRAGAITCGQWLKVVGRAADVLDRPDFGLRLAQRQGGVDVFGPLGAAMRSVLRFGDALSYAATHNAAHSLAARVWMGRSAGGQHVFMGHELLAEDLPARSQAIEQVLLAGHLGARAITGQRVGARRVHFRHQALSPAKIYREHFGCEVRFCQNEDGVVFTVGDLESPVADADRQGLRDVTEHVSRRFRQQRPPVHAQVRGVVMQLLWTGRCGNDDVARHLNLHPRTLHRRLHEESISFQSIKDEVRRDFMLYYLQQTDLPLSRISEKLGFAEQSVMSRFARSSLAASPREIRQAAREALP